jgi:arabinan endo-1,5-alpha-L-arabinosidase
VKKASPVINRRTALLTSFGAGAAGLLAPVLASAAPTLNDQLTGDLVPTHDPCIAKENGVYYVYGTAAPGSGLFITLKTSPDLKHWTSRGSVYKAIPQWALDAVPGTKECWAPDVTFFNGRWHMYFAYSTFGSNQSAIGLATTPTLDPSAPNYGWRDEGMVLMSHHSDDFNAIDPAHFVDLQGQHWLIFGSFWTGIKMRRLDPMTGKPAAGDDKVIALAQRPSPWGAPGAIEAPFMISRNGYYYLFASYDYCCKGVNSSYYTAFGRSKTIEGPFLAREGGDMLHGLGTVILRGDLEEHGRFRGPGHCAVFHDDDGQDYIVYHAYDARNGGASTLRIAPLVWSEDGWPTALA